METVLPLFTQHYFGWTGVQNGYIFTYVGIIAVIVQGGVVRQLVKVWSERTVLFGGLACFAVGLFLLAIGTQLSWLFMGLGILSLGEGAVMPTLSTLVTFVSPGDGQGEALGLSQGMGGLGRILGPLLASTAFERIAPGAPLLIGGVLALLVIAGAWPILHTISGPAREYQEKIEIHDEHVPSHIKHLS
jgi:fucose permease